MNHRSLLGSLLLGALLGLGIDLHWSRDAVRTGAYSDNLRRELWIRRGSAKLAFTRETAVWFVGFYPDSGTVYPWAVGVNVQTGRPVLQLRRP